MIPSFTYVTGIALDANDEIIGYKFVSLGKMTDFIKKGDDPNTAYEKACGLNLLINIQASIFCNFLSFFDRRNAVSI